MKNILHLCDKLAHCDPEVRASHVSTAIKLVPIQVSSSWCNVCDVSTVLAGGVRH